MKKFVFVFLLLAGSSASAAPAGRLGLGLIVGEPVGPTIKYFVTERQAFDVGIGVEDDPVFYADYLWHTRNLLRASASGTAALYAGVGPRFEDRDDREEDEFGFRFPFGVSFMLPRHPLEVFFEIVPVLEVSPDSDGDVDAGLGMRFYF